MILCLCSPTVATFHQSTQPLHRLLNTSFNQALQTLGRQKTFHQRIPIIIMQTIKVSFQLKSFGHSSLCATLFSLTERLACYIAFTKTCTTNISSSLDLQQIVHYFVTDLLSKRIETFDDFSTFMLVCLLMDFHVLSICLLQFYLSGVSPRDLSMATMCFAHFQT